MQKFKFSHRWLPISRQPLPRQSKAVFSSGEHHQLTRRINEFHKLRQSVPFHFLDLDALCSRLGEFVREHGVEIWRAGGEHALVSWDFHVTTDEDNITKLPVSEEEEEKERDASLEAKHRRAEIPEYCKKNENRNAKRGGIQEFER